MKIIKINLMILILDSHDQIDHLKMTKTTKNQLCSFNFSVHAEKLISCHRISMEKSENRAFSAFGGGGEDTARINARYVPLLGPFKPEICEITDFAN